MLAIGIEGAKNLAIALVVIFVALSLITAQAIKNVTGKIITMLVLIGLALGIWTERTALQDCADQVRAKVAAGDDSATKCTFFGSEVQVPT